MYTIDLANSDYKYNIVKQFTEQGRLRTPIIFAKNEDFRTGRIDRGFSTLHPGGDISIL